MHMIHHHEVIANERSCRPIISRQSGPIVPLFVPLLKTILVWIGIALTGAGYLQAASQEPSSSSPTPPASHRALVNRYCVTCHNEKLRTAELVLSTMDIEKVSEEAEVWERVVRKIRAGAMPPVGMPRPDRAALDSFITYLETELDRAAASNSNPGRPADHRLNRAEYANAIRDLLAMEVDVESLLPTDNTGYGFDNIGDILSISPLLMERYMLVAGKISRLAIGDPHIRPAGETYEVSDEFIQEARMSEDLPFGSRGGVAIRHRFPSNGEYTISVRLHKNLDGYIRGIGTPHRLDVRLDGARIKLFTIGGEIKGRSGPLFSANQNPEYRGDLEQVGYEFTADEALEVRFPAKAGTGLVGVAFLKQASKPVGILTPHLLLGDIDHYKGGNPAVESVTITGPYDANRVRGYTQPPQDFCVPPNRQPSKQRGRGVMRQEDSLHAGTPRLPPSCHGGRRSGVAQPLQNRSERRGLRSRNPDGA